MSLPVSGTAAAIAIAAYSNPMIAVDKNFMLRFVYPTEKRESQRPSPRTCTNLRLTLEPAWWQGSEELYDSGEHLFICIWSGEDGSSASFSMARPLPGGWLQWHMSH